MVDTNDEEATFFALPASPRRRIDSSFNKVTEENSGQHTQPPKRRKLNPESSSETPGAFIIEDTQPGGFIIEDSEPGGFIIDGDIEVGGFLRKEEDGSESDSPTHIPLSLIPEALELLGLPPDDEEVLSVFRNAASGWGSQANREEGVSRKDWRAVCAVLLEVHGAGNEDTEGNLATLSDRDDADHNSEVLDIEEDQSGSQSDEYQFDREDDEDELSEGDDSGDEYYEDALKSLHQKTSAKKATHTSSLLPDSAGSRTLTASQKRGCRETFSLFFPDIPDEELDNQKIMIKDITRVAKLLKEKIKVEEIIEMLEAFSTSPDKSMGLADFERMMVSTAMIYTGDLLATFSRR